MARCVCCGCVTDDDCCESGFYYNCGGVPFAGPFETAAECSAEAAATGCPGGGPVPLCYCASGDFECCDDGQCREFCEDLPP
jgi:hypothetical protein